MIARIWHGVVPVEKADAYLYLMRNIALADYKGISGNRGAFALHRIDGSVVHFIMLSLWESANAVKGFAGEDVEVAKYYDFDRYFLIEIEPHVDHYRVYEAS